MAARVAREVLAAERALPGLAGALDTPLARLGTEERVVAIGLGLRGWSLYRGFRHALSGPSVLAAHIDLRAVLDVAILARWMEDDPELRVRLWFAEDQRDRLRGGELVAEFLRRRGRPPTAPSPNWDPEAMEAEIRSAREAGLAAGLPLPRNGRRCLPTIEQMVQTVPDLWELYHVAYRHLSPVQHAGGRSFVGDTVEDRADGSYLRPGTPFAAPGLRALSVPALCLLLASVSRQAGLGIEAACDAVRMSVIVAPGQDAGPPAG